MSVIGTGAGRAADAQPASTTAASTISTATLIDRDTAIRPTLAFPVVLMSLRFRRPTMIPRAGPVRRPERDTGPPDMPLAPEGWELSIIHLARRCQALTADRKACRGSLRQLMGETIHQVRTGMLHPEYCQQRLPACGLEGANSLSWNYLLS